MFLHKQDANGLHAVGTRGQMTVLNSSDYITHVKPNQEQTLDFLRLLYGDAAPGYLTIWTPDKVTGVFSASDLSSAAAYVAQQAKTQNVYFGVGLQAEPPTGTSRGDAAGVGAIGGLWVDLDIGTEGHKKPGIPTLDDALDLLGEDGFPAPTVIIDTGHGLHAYWLFTQPWVFQDADDRAAAAAMVKRLQAIIRTKAEARGWNVDSTHDLARLLRPAGTVNRKGEPLPVKVYMLDEAQRYEPGDFMQYEVKAVIHAQGEDLNLDLSPVTPSPTPPASTKPGRVLTLVEHNDDPAQHWLDKAIRWVQNSEKDGRNEAGFDLACELRDAGLTQSEAEGVLMAYQSQVETAGDHPYTRDEALASLKQAFSRAPREPAKSPSALAVERTVKAIVAPAQADEDEANDGDADEEDTSPLVQDVGAPAGLGWLDNYVDLMYELTNAPRSFNLLCGVGTAAAAIQHRAVLRMAFGDVRPNVYGVIIAPSTVYHKTTTLSQSRSLLNRAGLSGLLFASQFSSEGLLSYLSEHPAGIIHRDEVGTLFASDRVKYLAMLKQDLTALYDCEDYSRQLARERITVSRPYLNILGATTPTRFYQNVTLADWQDGFLARWLFALPDCEPDFDTPAAVFTREHGTRLDALADRLREIDSRPAEDFLFQGDAFNRWDRWQREAKRTAYQYGDDVISSIVGRYSAYALKFAMILASLNGEFGRISPATMEQSIALADYFKAAVDHLLKERQNHGISGDKMQRVFYLIVNKGPQVRTKTIQQFAHLNASETRAVIDKLVEIGAVVTHPVGRGFAYSAITDKLPIRSWK